MTRLGQPIPQAVQEINNAVSTLCHRAHYQVISAGSRVTGRDFLLKIWKLIASAPLAVGVCHEEIPSTTQANIYYEMGVAQALGKETIIIKSPGAKIPSDFIRTEYIVYDDQFEGNYSSFMDSLSDQASHYEVMADQLDRNPILAIDYLKRAFLISGEERLREKTRDLLQRTHLEDRAKNSVELLAASF